MDIENILRDLLSLAGLSGAIYAIIRQNKIAPYERSEKDASASVSYADAAAKVADQVSGYLNRIEKLETKAEDFETMQAKLEETLRSRDRCIDTLNAELKKRDKLIADWAKGIKILIRQLHDAKIEPAWIPDNNDEMVFRPKD